MTIEPTIENQQWITILNVGTEPIPTYAGVEITGIQIEDGTPVLLVELRPEGGARRPVAVNSSHTIDPDRYGASQDTAMPFVGLVAEGTEVGDGVNVDITPSGEFAQRGGSRFRLLGTTGTTAPIYGYIIPRPSGGDTFLVKMVETGTGANGDSENSNTFLYNILDPTTDELLEADVQLPFTEASRHDYKTYELGEILPATFGLARYNDDDELVIHDCNEKIRMGPC
jgi:hypothetical protein